VGIRLQGPQKQPAEAKYGTEVVHVRTGPLASLLFSEPNSHLYVLPRSAWGRHRSGAGPPVAATAEGALQPAATTFKASTSMRYIKLVSLSRSIDT